MEKLRNYLADLTPGPVADPDTLARLLAACWNDFRGDDAGLEGYKLIDRIENVTWEPPVIEFTIERHGGTVMGSSRAELQTWRVDVEQGMATCEVTGFRQVRPIQRRLDVKALAREVADLIRAGQEDERFSWYPDGRVNVRIGKILPMDSAVKQTLAGRRKRFWKAIDEALGTDWRVNKWRGSGTQQQE